MLLIYFLKLGSKKNLPVVQSKPTPLDLFQEFNRSLIVLCKLLPEAVPDIMAEHLDMQAKYGNLYKQVRKCSLLISALIDLAFFVAGNFFETICNSSSFSIGSIA